MNKPTISLIKYNKTTDKWTGKASFDNRTFYPARWSTKLAAWLVNGKWYVDYVEFTGFVPRSY